MNTKPESGEYHTTGAGTGEVAGASPAAAFGGLAALFERQAAVRTGQVAVICGAETLTYGDLECRANQMARWLQAQGVARGDRVAFLLPRSGEVYVALLGLLKAGAAYVPLDPDYPAQRVQFILSDCQARALVTTRELAAKAAGFKGVQVVPDAQREALAACSETRLTLSSRAAAPEDLCYIIYTSGTTGRPKGVEIEHRSACHLVEAEGQLFQVRPEDRVYQGFSIAFDASVEEVWLAFYSGATLVAGTAEMVHAGAALAGMLTAAGVSILSCGPTLLAMMEDDIPSLRLLILGGEACPPDIVRRWWKPGRRVVNTYGPTEATVIATFADCEPSRPVTIGKPLDGYAVCVIDDRLQPVPAGTEGELCIGGIGLARGYVGRPDLTREKFIALVDRGAAPRRFYRTGDLVRFNASGDLEFLGRIDTQVKIRGFRVELSEIEAVLLESPGVKAAAVALREDVPGLSQLVAYVVAASGVNLDLEGLRAGLRARLPAYMMPAILEPIAALPLLPSGKVDRKALPVPRGAPAAAKAEGPPPRTPLERELLAAWQKVFAPAPVSIRADFFLDLGGHSLLAARMVSALRQSPTCAQLSMLDVYRHPTIESLAAELEQRGQLDGSRAGGASAVDNRARSGGSARDAAGPASEAAAEPFHIVPFWRHFFCGAAQAVALLVVLSFFALQWLTPYLTYTILVEEEYSFLEATLGAFASLILFYPVMLVIPILLKWLIIGRYKPGAYPLWGTYYFRWWFVTTMEAAVPVGYLAGTPWMNWYLRLMGARIGRNVFIETNSFAIYDLLSIGDDSSVNVDSNFLGYRVEHGQLKLGAIQIGKRCFVGTRCTLREDTVMADDSALEDLSLLSRGACIESGETWQGAPAERCPASNTPGPERSVPPGRLRQLGFALLQGVGMLIFPVLVVAALFPGIVLMNELNDMDPYYWYLLLAPLVGLSFVVLLAVEIAAVKWLLVGRLQPGQHSIHGFFYLRKWFVGQTMDLSLDILGRFTPRFTSRRGTGCWGRGWAKGLRFPPPPSFPPTCFPSATRVSSRTVFPWARRGCGTA